ncbi:fibronectin type III domain-containing protein, partial [Hymenobacter daeguensis]
ATLTGLTALTGYQFYVTQNCGGANGNSALSNAGAFTTNPNPAANDECTTAVGLTVAATCTTPTNGAVFGATQSLAPTANCGGTVANDVWYSFTATSTSHTITINPQFSAAYDVRSGACASTTSIFCATASSGTATNRTIGGLTVGQQYFIRIYASGTQPTTGPTSTFTLCVVPGPATPANDDCAGAINVPVQFVTCTTQVSADNTAATSSTGVPAPTCANYTGNDIWFKVTVPASGTVSIQTLPPTAGSNITDTGMSVYSGTCAALTEVQCDDDSSPNGLYSQVDLTNRTPGEVLYIRTWAYGGNSSGLIAVCVTSPSNCAMPTTPSVGTITDVSAVLNWVAPTGGTTGNTFEIEYGLQNFVQGTGTTITGIAATTTTRTITGLTPNSNYCFYVRQNCGTTNGSSAWAGPTCFVTPLTVPTNDEPCGAIGLGSGTRTGTTVGSTTTVQSSILLPVCSPSSQPKDVWFAFTATAATASFTLTGAPAGMVRVYASPSCSAGPFTLV